MFQSNLERNTIEPNFANDSAKNANGVPTMNNISFNHIKLPGNTDDCGSYEDGQSFEQPRHPKNIQNAKVWNQDFKYSSTGNANVLQSNANQIHAEPVNSFSYFRLPELSDTSSRISEYGQVSSINPGNNINKKDKSDTSNGSSALGIVFDRSKNINYRQEDALATISNNGLNDHEVFTNGNNNISDNDTTNSDGTVNNYSIKANVNPNQFYKSQQQNLSETSIGTSIPDTFLNPVKNNNDDASYLSTSLSALTFSPLSTSRLYLNKLNQSNNSNYESMKKKEKSSNKVFQKAFKRSRRGSLKKDNDEKTEHSDLSDIASIKSNNTASNNFHGGGTLSRSSTASSLKKKMILVSSNTAANNIMNSSKKLLMNFDFVKPKINNSSIVSSLSPSGSRKSSVELKRIGSNGSAGSLHLAPVSSAGNGAAANTNSSISKRSHHHHHHHHHHLLLRGRKEPISNVASSSSSNSKVSDIPMLYNFNSSAVHSNNNELIRGVTQIENEILNEKRITEEKQKDLIDKLLNLLYSHTLPIFKGENLSVPLEDLSRLIEVYILIRSLKKNEMRSSVISKVMSNSNLLGYLGNAKNGSVTSFGNNEGFNDTYSTIRASLSGNGTSGSAINMNEIVPGDNLSNTGSNSFNDHRSRSGSSSQHSRSSLGGISGNRINAGNGVAGIANLEVHDEEEDEETENHELALIMIREFSEFLKVGISLMENQSNIDKITKFEHSKFNKFTKFEKKSKENDSDEYESDYEDQAGNEYDKKLKIQEMEMNSVASLWDFYFRNVISYLEMILFPLQMYFDENEVKIGLSSNSGATSASTAVPGGTNSTTPLTVVPSKKFEYDINVEVNGKGNVVGGGNKGGNSSDVEQWTVKKMLLIVFRDMIIIPRVEKLGVSEYLYYNRFLSNKDRNNGFDNRRSSDTSGMNDDQKNDERISTVGTINSEDNVEKCLLQCFGLVATLGSRDYKQNVINELFVAMKYYK